MRLRTSTGLHARALEGVLDPLQRPPAHGHHVEANDLLGRGLPSQPGLGGAAQAPLLALVDHLERIAVAPLRLLLDLAEDDRAAAAAEQIDLDPGQAQSSMPSIR